MRKSSAIAVSACFLALLGASGGKDVGNPSDDRGPVALFAGSLSERGTEDGVGSKARFADPHGLAVDRAGNVYVADAKNYAIRRVTPTGEVSTYAGIAGPAGAAARTA